MLLFCVCFLLCIAIPLLLDLVSLEEAGDFRALYHGEGNAKSLMQ